MKHKLKTILFIGLALIALFGMTACPNAAGGSNEIGSSGGGGNTGGSQKPKAPFVEGGASLILSPDKLDIKVTVATSDGTPVTVEGCTETTLPSGTETVLHAKGTLVILKGKIIDLQVGGWHSNNKLIALNVQGLTALRRLECHGNQLTALNVQGLSALQRLDCSSNQLTALNVQGLSALQRLDCSSNQLTALNVQGCSALKKLWCGYNQLTELNVQGCTSLQQLLCYNSQLIVLNVQGCTALKELDCDGNQLTAQAFTKLFDDLPQRDAGVNGRCTLYTEKDGITEGNHKDFTAPPDLAAAFNNAKTVKKWKMYKYNGSRPGEEI